MDVVADVDVVVGVVVEPTSQWDNFKLIFVGRHIGETIVDDVETKDVILYIKNAMLN